MDKERITREEAIDIIVDELDSLDNEALLSILDEYAHGDYEIKDDD